MKTCLICVLLFTSLISCKQEELSSEFKKEIVKYQKNIPLPTMRSGKSKTFLYVVNFEKKVADTLFNLIRCPGVSKFDSISGIYKDADLRPLAIIDRNNLGTDRLYFKKSEDLSKYINDSYLTEDFPPLYQYKIKNGKIILIKIDTISDQWIK